MQRLGENKGGTGMNSIIIVLPKLEDAKRIKAGLTRNGFKIDAVYTTASQALNEIHTMDGGIVISTYRLPDMFYMEFQECLPSAFEMLLIASKTAIANCEGSGIVSLATPLSVYELVNTVQMMLNHRSRRMRREKAKPKMRSEREQKIIDDAKHLLMERNNLSEEDAYRYIQKCSMDSGTNMVETAEMITTLMHY